MKKLSESDLLLWRKTNKDNPFEYKEMIRNLEAPTPTSLPREILKKLANKKLPIDATLDLHGYDRISAREQAIKFIKGSVNSQCKYVCIITGKGKGLVRDSVLSYLKEKDSFLFVVGYSSAHRLQGGDGAIIIHLRKKKH